MQNSQEVWEMFAFGLVAQPLLMLPISALLQIRGSILDGITQFI